MSFFIIVYTLLIIAIQLFKQTRFSINTLDFKLVPTKSTTQTSDVHKKDTTIHASADNATEETAADN